MSTYKFRTKSAAEQVQADEEQEELWQAEQRQIDNAPISSVHSNLLQFRLRKGYKKQEMADFMEISSRTYYTYEKGLRPIPSDALINLATMTGADLHEILMGRRATTDAQAVRAAMSDTKVIIDLLKGEYPDMDSDTKAQVASQVVMTDWGNWPRMHPEVIQAAVFRVTRYRYFPEDLPAPPFFENYVGNQNQYEIDVKEWQAVVDFSFGKNG